MYLSDIQKLKEQAIWKVNKKKAVTNIEEMEKQVDFLTKRIVDLELEGTTAEVLRDFMRMSIDELKDQADRMAGIEKAMAEMQLVDDGSHLIKFDTRNEIKVEETD
jgi:flagellar motor component MotA